MEEYQSDCMDTFTDEPVQCCNRLDMCLRHAAIVADYWVCCNHRPKNICAGGAVRSTFGKKLRKVSAGLV